MSSIQTSFTRLLGIRAPIVCPPMAGASGGLLASHVSLADGFGFIAAGYDSLEKIRGEISLARNTFGIASNDQPLPIGVGFLVWQLETLEDRGFSIIDAVLQENIRALWFSFGNNLHEYINYVHDRTGQVPGSPRPLIFILVSNADDAEIAVKQWNVDVIVAQGIESGGHGYRSAPPLLSLVSSILERLQGSVPVIAAGGLATGSHVAAMLTAGASGACLGTRFLLTPESFYTPAQKNVLLSAKSESAVRTMAFDYARGTLGWPKGVDGRGILNETVKDYNEGKDLEDIRQNFTTGVEAGDPKRMLVWSGTGVGQMDRILPAAEIMQELVTECLERIRATAKLLDQKAE